MGFICKKSPWIKEWEDLEKREAKFIEKRMAGPTCVIIGKLERFVPKKLSSTLNAAFFKGFQVIFEKGTGIIEKTYNKSRKENEFQINTFATELSADKRVGQEFYQTGALCKEAEIFWYPAWRGIGLGLGWRGDPDPGYPLFIAMV